MENLTKEKAIELHRKMWRWIADETEKQKRFVTKYEAFQHFGWDEESVTGNEWLCEYAEQNGSEKAIGRDCFKCPLRIPGTEKSIWESCLCSPASSYKQWRRIVVEVSYFEKPITEEDITLAAKYAREFANAPIKED